MRFKADENLPIDISELLRQQGHDAQSVVEQGLAGGIYTPETEALINAPT